MGQHLRLRVLPRAASASAERGGQHPPMKIWQLVQSITSTSEE